jgi:D-amino-acid dehydrogenase
VPIRDAAKAPSVSLTDDEAKIVITRLGERMRIAGTAELSGYSTHLNPVRCEALTRRVGEMFPEAGEYDKATFWTGLRPSTPSNVPIIGATRFGNLYLNTGHGTLGWTMAAGSGRALADIISGRKPDVDFKWSR